MNEYISTSSIFQTGSMKLHSSYLIQLCLMLLLWIDGCRPSVQLDKITDFSWYTPRPVKGYRSYQDVYPVRYEVPKGLTEVLWTFQTSRVSGSCDDDTVIHILLQHSGLPLVSQSNLSFPDNYVVPKSPTVKFTMKPVSMISMALLRPSEGSWYAIAYLNGGKQAIQQQGLSSHSSCMLSFMSHVQMGKSIEKQEVLTRQNNTLFIGNRGSVISFTVEPGTYAFEVIITDCAVANCSITVMYKPFNAGLAVSKTCIDVPMKPCILHVPAPSYIDEQLIVFQLQSVNATWQPVSYYINPLECSSIKRMSQSAPCFSMPAVGRLNSVEPFRVWFGYILTESLMSLDILVSMAPIVVVPFEIREPSDVGGTLQWKITHSEVIQNVTDLDIYLCGALVYNKLPDMSNQFDVCENINNSVFVVKTDSGFNDSTQYVPYPRTGDWHIMLQATCYHSKNGSKTRMPCPKSIVAVMKLSIQPCQNDGCNGKGECTYNTIGSDLVTVSYCKCAADYRGYACTDGSQALSDSVQLAGAFLLTMSNLLFIPSIVIALRRRFYLEAFVFFYTMLFSTFYHACDGDRVDKYKMCIMPFDVLQSGDFFGSSCSLWFTLVAMARIKIHWVTRCLQLLGPFSLVIGVVYDKTSLYVIAVPTLTGLVIIIASWSHKMYKGKCLYPSLKRYLIFLLPGVILAATGAALFAFLETEDNYKYVHSVWHVTIALSICFLLPPKNVKLTDMNKNESNMQSTSYLLDSVDGAFEGSTAKLHLFEEPEDSEDRHPLLSKSDHYHQHLRCRNPIE